MANTDGGDDENVEVEETDQGSRELGVEFGDLADDLQDHEYPTSVDTLLEEFGDRELELPSGEQSFGEVIDPYAQEPDQQFNDPGEVRQAVLNMVGPEAVGEDRYSDRGLDNQDEDTQSF